MDSIANTTNVLKKGGVVIFPTDTVFGIGCRVSDKKSIKRLYKIKKRSLGNPMLILVKDYQQAQEYGIFNAKAEKLAREFWPGPLTLVVAAREAAPKIIRSSDNSIGVRQPKHQIVEELIEAVGEPILAPSANFTGKRAPEKLSEIDNNLVKLVDFVLDFDCGGGRPSTVVKILDNKHQILRKGQISSKSIIKKLEEF